MGMFSDRCLIYAQNAENTGLEGRGTIDGRGQRGKFFPNPGDPDGRRPMLVRFQDCQRIYLRDITLIDPASFATFFVHSRNIVVDAVTIRSRNTPNGDGLDFDGCANVLIANCDLDCGDDAISLKPLHPDWPCQNFCINNCTISSQWAAIRIGPESRGDTRHVVVSNCVFTDCRDGLKIQNCEGGVTEDLLFDNIVMRDVNRPMFITLNRFSFSAYELSSRPPIAGLRNIQCSNIRATARRGDPANVYDQPCVSVVALPGYAIENVTLSNVHLTMPGGGTAEQAARMDVAELLDFGGLWPEALHFGGELPCSSIYFRHVRGISLNNVRLSLERPDARPFVAGDDIDGLDLIGMTAQGSQEAQGLAKLADARHVTVRDCRLYAGGHEAETLLVPLTPEEEERLATHRRQVAALIGPTTRHRITVQVRKEDGEAGIWRPVELRLER
jgi:hypothetical protein